MRKECHDSGPVVNNQPGDYGTENTKKKSPDFRYFSSMFCGALLGSLVGTLFVKLLILLFDYFAQFFVILRLAFP